MAQIRNDNFITIQGWMVNELHLKGNELMVYAIIYGFSQDGESEFKGSRRYLASWLGCSLPTVDKALNGLIAKNLIIKTTYTENEIKFNRYKISLQGVKNLYKGCKESLQGYKETLLNNIDNNIINKDNKTNSKELVQNSTSSSFLGSAKQKPKKESLYSKCINLIDDFTKNVKIRNLLIQYLNLRLEMKDKPLYTNQWKGLLNKLKELEKDNNIEDVITQSIEKGYASFYPVNKSYKSNKDSFSEGDGLKCDSITDDELAHIVQHRF